MTNLVVNSRIVAAGLKSTQYLTDAIALGQLLQFRERGLKAVARRSQHDWIAAVVTPDEGSMLMCAGGYVDQAAAIAAAELAVTELRAS